MTDSYPFTVSNDQYYPGLMYVNNVLDGSSSWYPGQENNPAGGVCGQRNLGSNLFVVQFTNGHVGMDPAAMSALYGITACPNSFNADLLLDLGTPAANGGLAEIEKFQSTSDLNNLHELLHLVSLAGKMCHSKKMQTMVCRDMLIKISRSHWRHRCHISTRQRLD